MTWSSSAEPEYARYFPGMIVCFHAGLGSIQFRNWNCSSIPIPIPELELELELKLVELKMELELKTLELELELELKTGIEFFAATAAITS